MASNTTANGTSNLPKGLPVPNPIEPFWHRDLHELSDHRSTGQLPEHSDVVIIGGGYAGITTAYHLVKDRKPDEPKLSITLLEARHACSGATGRNGGHLRPDYYSRIPIYIDRYGVEAATEYAEYEISHIQAIKEVIEKEEIDCDFVLTRSTTVFTNQTAIVAAKAIWEKMKSHNLKYFQDADIAFEAKAEEISGVKGATVAATYTSAHLWPYKLMLGLLAKIVPTGDVNLQTYTPVTSVKPSSSTSGGYTVNTPRGQIHGSKVVWATNGYTGALLPEYSRNIIPCKGICTSINCPSASTAAHLSNSYIISEPDGVLSYLIPRPDGSIIVGGASRKFHPKLEQWYNNTDDSVLIDEVKDYWEGFMQRTFHGYENTDAHVDKIWTGVMGYSYDSLPHVGVVPNRTSSDELILAGFNGHGMPVIYLAAKGIAKMIREECEYEDTGLPLMMKTTRERIERAQKGGEGEGDILGDDAKVWKSVGRPLDLEEGLPN